LIWYAQCQAKTYSQTVTSQAKTYRLLKYLVRWSNKPAFPYLPTKIAGGCRPFLYRKGIAMKQFLDRIQRPAHRYEIDNKRSSSRKGNVLLFVTTTPVMPARNLFPAITGTVTGSDGAALESGKHRSKRHNRATETMPVAVFH